MAAHTAMKEAGRAEEITITSVVVALLVLATVIGLGSSLISVYVKRERDRDLQQWEARLGLAADTRAASLAAYTRKDREALLEVAGNASLQLYLGQVYGEGEAGEETAGQRAFLRNLLIASAARLGYGSSADARLPANVAQRQDSGLLLLDEQLRLVAQTPGAPPLSPEMLTAAELALESSGSATSRMHRDAEERVLLAHAQAISRVLGSTADGDASGVGVLLGVRNTERGLLELLSADAYFAEDSEALLLTQRNDQVVYLSVSRDGSAPLRRALPMQREGLAAAAALREPGAFHTLDNYRGQPVLQVSRPVRGHEWVLVQQVDARQALRESDQRRRFLFVSLSLLLFAVVALAIAAWRHGSSVRARHRATELEEKGLQLSRQTDLLNVITGNIDALVMLVDSSGVLRFANSAAVQRFGKQAEELIGNPLGHALGADLGRTLARGIASSQTDKTAGETLLQLNGDEQLQSFQARFLPVAAPGLEGSTLLVLNDVTALEEAQARHTRLLQNLVGSLVQLIDLHDPYSAFHSARMVEVAAELAEELRLPEEERRTLDFAATLANLGKITLPTALLTKTESLSEVERESMESHVSRGLDLLTNLDFDLPVLSTIAQKQEHLDGSGYPRGLHAEELTLPGRILAVANAFVALVSPRAYREALPVPEALDEMMRLADRCYDRRVVAALFHVAENRIDWDRWQREDSRHREQRV